jgi:molybdate transport system substrate-binding protein
MKTILSRVRFLLLLTVVLGPIPAAQARAGDVELVVSAAASLTDAFNAIAPAFEAIHPGVDVNVDVLMNFAASGALYRQIERGAPVDVYAAANPKWMERAVTGGFVARESVTVFARNVLVLAVPKDNPAALTAVSDLTAGRVTHIGIGTPATVPAGQYARAALAKAQLFDPLRPKLIYCESVRQVLDYLLRGEVDGGFIYRTDAARGGERVRVVAEMPLDHPVVYPIAVLKESRVPDLARRFVAFVTSGEGLDLLAASGFKSPKGN